MPSRTDDEQVVRESRQPSKRFILQSSKTSGRLNQIDRIRANGVGDHIALPQLVVCGDQSAGKSSVLEGISGIPFPRQDGLCTRFATEIILRHDPNEVRFTATITPHPSRDEDTKGRLKAYCHQFEDFDELPTIIDQAAKLMGVYVADSNVDGPAFAADVLSCGQRDDVQLVGNLVDSYLEHSRTIILAVVPASSDVDTQGIIQRARRFDKAGVRTVGIITKPDLINSGTESRVAKLAKNCDRTKLNLGFFLLKNPTPKELKTGMTSEERCKIELAYFANEPWNKQNLDPSRIGIDRLRSFLQDLLDRHIERELPKVREEVRRLLQRTNQKLDELGAERKSPSQIRTFLTGNSTMYHNLVQAGVEGSYGGRDATFFETIDDRLFVRFRAAIHMENEKFSDYMRENGEKRKIVSVEQLAESPVEKGQLITCHIRGNAGVDTTGAATIWLCKKNFFIDFTQVYHQTRGQELPGTYNHVLVTKLFHDQSSRWGQIAGEHMSVISKLASRFVEVALEHTIKDSNVRRNVHRLVRIALEANAEAGNNELQKLLEDEARQPIITYNHYYTDNVQKSRDDGSKKQIQQSVHDIMDADWDGCLKLQNTKHDIDRLITSLQKRTIVDMKEQACSDAKTDLKAYYKVARKSFVDNVCRQVIERHIVANLTNAFNPNIVSCYSDEKLLHLAAEPPQLGQRRSNARQLQGALEQSLRDLAI